MALDLRAVDLATESIRTERLLLRPPRPGDEDAVYRACQDPEILHWTISLPTPYTRADAEAWVRDIAPTERAEGRGLACVVERAGELVGSAGVHWQEGGADETAEVGYWIAPQARRQGYAAEAAGALAEWAFAHGAEEVRLLTLVGNTASQGVARRAGFRQEGTLRHRLRRLDGSRVDAVLFTRHRPG